MNVRAAAGALAVGRVAYGTGLVLAPTAFARAWIGGRARDPRTRVMCRGLGARDLILGAGSLLSMRRADLGSPRWWFAAQALSDGVDLVATLAVGDALPAPRRRGVAGMAAASAAIAAAGALSEPDSAPATHSNQEM